VAEESGSKLPHSKAAWGRRRTPARSLRSLR